MTQDILPTGSGSPPDTIGEPTKRVHPELPRTEEPASKKPRIGEGEEAKPDPRAEDPKKRKGIAAIKDEYLIKAAPSEDSPTQAAEGDQDTRDSRDPRDRNDNRGDNKRGKRQKNKGGQNIMRSYGRSDDTLKLCSTRALSNEFSPKDCQYGEKCNKVHDLRRYLAEGRRADLETFEGKCPVFEKNGRCPSGWRCRFVKSHSSEVEREDGRKELVLIESTSSVAAIPSVNDENEEQMPGVANIIAFADKINLNRKRVEFPKSDAIIKWIEEEAHIVKKIKNASPDEAKDLRASFVDPPVLPSEKRKIYFGAETPVLAPLTTQGNLPFRRLCVELGAQITYSEMAMGLPMLQGQKADWTIIRTHESELSPPKFAQDSGRYVVKDYDNSRDFKFGAQISGTQPWVVTKCAEALVRYTPRLRVIDLNCGCPIDMVFKSGAGSGLLDNPAKLERMIRGMNSVSDEVPITTKLRTGVKEGRPTAERLIDRLAFGDPHHRERLGAPGCAAITLHGRSRQQRYTKLADWSYIGECATLVQSYRDKKDDLTDTIREPDARTLAPGGEMYFLGNGDCYSHVDYNRALAEAKVDTVMIGRGAMIKPWVFEEIQAGQFLDKSATERLGYVEKFCKFGLETWGSDELGIGFTRRFLLEWMSFTYRYIPVGILERLPASLNDRPPAYKGRNEIETLLASDNYKDWIKISEMYLGPAHPDFKFQPKHKSNSYEMEAEG